VSGIWFLRLETRVAGWGGTVVDGGGVDWPVMVIDKIVGEKDRKK
jgi:hypothetical protein